MAVTIRIAGDEATVDRGRWTSDVKELEDLLNIMRTPHHSWDLDYSLTLAKDVLDHFPGEIVSHTRPVYEFDPDVAY